MELTAWIPWITMLIQTVLYTDCIWINPTDYCSGQSLKANCPQHHVIVMQSAMYGRMRTGTCLVHGTNNTGCRTNVLHLADNMCSGKSSCEIRVTNLEMDGVMKCNRDLIRYLSAAYQCERVFNPKHQCSSVIKLPVSIHTNHISSTVSRDTGCGINNSPYLLEALPGQRISLLLIDFSVLPSNNNRICIQSYGNIVDLHDNKVVNVCMGTRRIQQIYVTKGNKAQVLLEANVVNVKTFLLQIKVIGCADIIVSKDSWIKRNGEHLIVGCHHYRQTWHLKCQGYNWIGVIGNCSQGHYGIVTSVQVKDKQTNLSHAVLIFLIALVAIVMCAVIVTVGIFYSRRSLKTNKPEVNHYDNNINTTNDRGRYMHISCDPDKPMTVPDYCSDVNGEGYDVTSEMDGDDYLLSKQEEYISVDHVTTTGSKNTVVEQWLCNSTGGKGVIGPGGKGGTTPNERAGHILGGWLDGQSVNCNTTVGYV